MKFEEIYKKVLDADKKYKERGIPINLDLKIEDLRDALIESKNKIDELQYYKKRLEDAITKVEEREQGYYQEWKKMFESFSPIKKESDALRKQNAYLRMLAAHAISRVYRMRYSMAWFDHPFEKGRKKERYERWIDKFVVLYRKAKAEFENLKGR